MRIGSRLVALAFAAAALLVSLSCSERTLPTEDKRPDTPAAAVSPDAGTNNVKVKIKQLQLTSNTLRIDGPADSGIVNMGNSGPAIQSGVSLHGEIVQGAATRQALDIPVNCSPGQDPGQDGFLPNGGCQMAFSATASNSAPGTGTLVSGAAVLVLQVLQDGTELAVKSIDINLVATPSILSLTLAATTVAIEGPSTTFTAVIQNPASSLQGVILQGYITQGGARRASGGAQVTCGSAPGVFPPGTCTFSFTVSASNGAAGSGTLAPGAALFELDLTQSSGGAVTVYDTQTSPITLVSSAPVITSLVLASTDVVIGGSGVTYTAQLQNYGFPVSDVVLQGEIDQGSGIGAATRAAGGTTIDCGAGTGVLPTTAQCTISFTLSASNSNAGTGTLVAGAAVFTLRMDEAPGGGPTTELDTASVAITLVSPNPVISSLTPSSQYVVLEGGSTAYTAVLENPGPDLTGVLVQGWIQQGVARRAAGGEQVTCGGGSGDLPTGSCTVSGDIVASNSDAGSGTLAPGDATFELELKVGSTVVDTASVPITIVADAPSIVSIVMSSDTIPIGGSVNYVATLYNPTGASLSDVLIQGYIDQGAAERAAGGTVVTCGGANGELPAGSCTVSFVAAASNGNSGSGTLVAGPATFKLEMLEGATVLDTKTVAVTLTSSQ